MSRTWNTRIEQNIHSPSPKKKSYSYSYSPWSLASSTIKLNTNLPPHCPHMLGGLGYEFDFVSSLSCETYRQFDYNLSNNWWFVILNCFKIMFKMSHYQWLHMVGNLEYVWKISFRILAGAKRGHESPLHNCHHSYNCERYECRHDGVLTKGKSGRYVQFLLIHTFSKLLEFRLFS